MKGKKRLIFFDVTYADICFLILLFLSQESEDYKMFDYQYTTLFQ